MKHIPNLITSLNLASGFMAIIFASNGQLLPASWFIAAAMIFDFLDGFSARLLKAYSDIGKELDSLADVVSFGVAPGVIIFRLLHVALMPGSNEIFDDNISTTLILIIPAIMPACAALRLAIFNLDKSQVTTFKGLPTPANAIGVISIIIAVNYSESSWLTAFSSSPRLLILFTVFLSVLMVTRISLFSLKLTNFGFKGNEGRYILAVMLLIAVIAFGINALPLIIPLYIIASVAGNAFFNPVLSK